MSLSVTSPCVCTRSARLGMRDAGVMLYTLLGNSVPEGRGLMDDEVTEVSDMRHEEHRPCRLAPQSDQLLKGRDPRIDPHNSAT
eukprot:5408037-Amphidinium_carterae.1